MVTTGYSMPYVAKYTNSGATVTYDSGMKLGRGVNVSSEIEQPDDNNFYADNVLAETESAQFVSGSLTITIDGLDNDAAILLLGLPAAEDFTVDSGTTVSLQHYGKAMNPPYVGFGYVRRTMENGATKYFPVVHPKCKFSIPADSAATQEDQIDWQTQELSATLLRDDTEGADWKITSAEGLDTEDAAVAVLKKYFNITSAG